MQVKKIKDEALTKGYEITIPSGEINKKIDSKLQEYGRTIHLKGFRPGKAPIQVLRQHYGRRVRGEILESAVNEATRQLIEDKKIRAAKQPTIEVVSFDEGSDLVYNIELEQVPDFELQTLDGLVLEKKVADIRDEEVEEALKKVAKYNKKLTLVKEKRAAKKGDVVKIDFSGELKDGTKVPGMDGQDFDLELGGGQFIPGFEDQLIGSKAGAQVDVSITFPEEYQVGQLAGKEAVFSVTVKEIQQSEELEIGEELATKVGFKSLASLKESIRNKLQSEYEGLSAMKLKKALLDKLDDQYEFELPQGLVSSEYEAILRQVEHEQAHSHDHSHDHDHDHGHSSLSEEEKEELREIAVRRVRLGLVLAEIGRENAIEVTSEEIRAAVMKEAQKYPGNEQQVIDYYTGNPQAYEMLRAPIFEEKVIEYILDGADIKEIIVSPEDLAREDDEEDSALTSNTSPKETTKRKGGAKKSQSSSLKEKQGAEKKHKNPAKKRAPADSGSKKAAAPKKTSAKSKKKA